MTIIEKVKAKSITSKAKAACQINMGLVYGAADVQASKGFRDYGGIIDKGMESSKDSINPIDTEIKEKTKNKE